MGSQVTTLKELLHEEVLEKHGAFENVKRWWKGKHTNGTIIRGLTGWETITEETIIRPERKFLVKDD